MFFVVLTECLYQIIHHNWDCWIYTSQLAMFVLVLGTDKLAMFGRGFDQSRATFIRKDLKLLRSPLRQGQLNVHVKQQLTQLRPPACVSIIKLTSTSLQTPLNC